MPYVKPGVMLDWKVVIASILDSKVKELDEPEGELRSLFEMCVVCGKKNCGKTVVEVNGVYVHQEDAAEAEPAFEYEL